ncbi:MAG: nucleoside-diphosphate sugar epimerase/dehydratase [Muribaculaceae bacterium]|nr:nucleoside-diphosphate sugar epimerase/dehydratase [Muribaculaceae bacterium]
MNIFSWYFSKRALPYWAIFIIDCLIVLFSFAAVQITLGGITNFITCAHTPQFLSYGICLLCYILGFHFFRTYSGVIRYSSFVDLQRIGFAAILAVACIFIISMFTHLTVSRAEILLSSIVAVLFMWMVRVIVKYLYDTTAMGGHKERIFIYGVKLGGISLAKSIRNQHPAKYEVVGFVSDGVDMQNRILMGVPVFPNDENLVEEMKSRRATEIFVSPLKTEALRQNTDMQNRLIEGDIKILAMPSEVEWNGKTSLSHSQLKPIELEDLLPRDAIEIDMDAIGKLLKGRKILITGAAGSIGSEMVRQIASYTPSELILVDQAETPLHDVRLMMAREWPDLKAYTIIGNISNASRMEEIFVHHMPEYVFHAAAYKHVPMMEDNPRESIYNNVYGTQVIADLAVKYGVNKFVMISTDKAVNPTNVMGCSKRICEIYVQSLDKAIKDGKIKGSTQFVTTRFGNVLGSNGSVIPLFKQQISKGGPITVTDPNIVRYFMLIPEACKLVLQAGTMGHGGEIYVFDMGKPVKIVDLATRMIKLSGAQNIEIAFTGLRDGEKLYEEVLNDKELTLPTNNPKIKIAKVREYDYMDVSKDICNLIDSSATGDCMGIVALMKDIVPEFKSNHSIYEVLDKK